MTDTLWGLASLACEAAIELDNYSLGRERNELATVANLGEWLTENVPTREQLSQPGGGIWGESFSITHRLAKKYAPALGPTTFDLVDWVHAQVAKLKAEATTNPTYWRGWCLSLSEIASAESSYRRR